MTDARLATLPQEQWLAHFEALSAGSLRGSRRRARRLRPGLS
jgi:hypothetical protein